MTTESRMERRLPEILEELYLGRTPDYRDEVLAAAVRTRQRPSWTFPGRWLPMADIASRPAFAPRLPWRALTVAFLIGALLLAVGIAYLGSRQPRVPLPFGLADNGLIAYSADGDIWTADPLTGVTNAIVTGTDDDAAPVYSPDGTKIAFVRKASIDGSLGEEIVVVSSDGSNPTVVSRQPAARSSTHLEWAPDSRSLLTGVKDLSEILILDATALAEPRTVATDADLYPGPYQPPVGDAILIGRSTTEGSSMVRLDLASGKETTVATGPDVLADARWSPDGGQIVFSSPPTTDQDSRRLFLVNADGSDLRQITSAPGVWWDIAPVWSPDGKRIAFLPYERTADYDIRRPSSAHLHDRRWNGQRVRADPSRRPGGQSGAGGRVRFSRRGLVVRLGSRWDIADRVSHRGVGPPGRDRRGDRRVDRARCRHHAHGSQPGLDRQHR